MAYDPEQALIDSQNPLPKYPHRCDENCKDGHNTVIKHHRCYFQTDKTLNEYIQLKEDEWAKKIFPDYINLSAHPLRTKVVEILQQMEDFGVHDKPEGRAYTYGSLIMLWGDNNLDYWKKGCDKNRSSCGMLIRSLWRLLGCRAPSLSPPYSMDPNKRMFDGLFNAARATNYNARKSIKTFADLTAANPQPGDVVYIQDPHTNDPGHIFTIIKRDGDGVSNPITFVSIDGGQTGPGYKDGGCCGIHRVTRTLPIKSITYPPSHGKTRKITYVIKINEMLPAFTARIIELKNTQNEFQERSEQPNPEPA